MDDDKGCATGFNGDEFHFATLNNQRRVIGKHDDQVSNLGVPWLSRKGCRLLIKLNHIFFAMIVDYFVFPNHDHRNYHRTGEPMTIAIGRFWLMMTITIT